MKASDLPLSLFDHLTPAASILPSSISWSLSVTPSGFAGTF